MSYERLIAEHGRIDIGLGRLLLLIDTDEPDADAITIALSDLSRELIAHLYYEHRFIYPRMIASPDAHVAITARKFVEDFAPIRADWGLYLSEWNRDCILADWTEFCRYTRAIVARLTERIRAENEQLYTAALQAGAIRLRKAA